MLRFFEHWVVFSVKKRGWVVFVAILLMILGVYSFTQLKIDAYPDISGVQVQIITPFIGRAAEEVEQQVTIPVERAMAGVPHVESVRSRTIFGLSNVQLVFDPEVTDEWARFQIFQKLTDAELPEDAKPELASLSNNYGEIFRYELVSDRQHSLIELRTLQDWVIIPALLRVRGIVEIGNFGGLAKQYAVRVDRDQLLRYRVSLQDVIQAIKANNTIGGGNIVSIGSTSLVVRGIGRYYDFRELANVLIRNSNGTLVYLKDVARLETDHAAKTGEFGFNHQSDGIEGIVRMRRGEDASLILPLLEEAVEKLNQEVLPAGVKIKPFFSRQVLIRTTLTAVSHNVILGIILVLLTLFAFLRSGVISFIVALTIPFSFLFALILMKLAGIPISLLSVGAIDFGIIVDGGVIVAENIARLIAKRRHEALSSDRIIIESSQQVLKPMLFSMLIVILAYLPLLSLRYVEGLLFRPMAMTLCFAFLGALISALLLVPALFRLLVDPAKVVHKNDLMNRIGTSYSWILDRVLKKARWISFASLALLILVVGAIFPVLGTEFLPYLDEGSFWIRATFPEGISLEENAKYANQLRELISSYAEVSFVLSQSGRVDSGTDPYPLNRCEIMVGLHPPHEWKTFKTKHELEDALQARLKAEFPTLRLNLTQPIMDGVTEDTNGTSADLAVEFSGPQLEVLRSLGEQTVDILKTIKGHRNVYREQEGPQPQLQIKIDRQRTAQYQLSGEGVTNVINTAIGGQPLTPIFEQNRRFNIVAKYLEEQMGTPGKYGLLPVFNDQEEPVPLAQLADIRIFDGETLIARGNGQRRVTIRTDIRDRAQGEFVAEAQKKVRQKLQLPEGYSIAWKGMFENLDRARKHFAILIPLTVVIIFGVLLFSFQSAKIASIVMLNLPFALLGSAIALFIRGMHLSVSAGVGFTSLFGVSAMQGVVMVSTIHQLQKKGDIPLLEAVRSGATQRLRPILMTSLTAMIGLLPASLATGVGTDVQRSIATVVVWGIFSAALMTLLVLPAIYLTFSHRDMD